MRSPGEGSLVQRKDGRWQASLQVDGRRRTVYGKTRSECAARLADLQRQAAAMGTLPHPGKRTVSDMLDAWLDAKWPTWKPLTSDGYRKTCERYLRPALGGVALAKLTPERVSRLCTRLEAKGQHRTALKAYRALSQACAQAVRWGWLSANPCDRVDVPRYRAERHDVWTPEQLRAFLEGTREHWLYPLWVTLAATGCRVGEALALEWADVDLHAGTLTVSKSVQRIGGERVVTTPKTRAGVRTVTLPQQVVWVLRRHEAAQAERRLQMGPRWAAGDVLFTGERGGALGASTVGHAIKRECDRLGLPIITPHGLRHLHASLLLSEGLPVPEVTRRMGHANSAITMGVYAHVVRKDDAAATEAIGRVLGAS